MKNALLILFLAALGCNDEAPTPMYGCAMGRPSPISERVVYACQTVGEFAADTTTQYVDRQWVSICNCKH